jgi:hypothetical protein
LGKKNIHVLHTIQSANADTKILATLHPDELDQKINTRTAMRNLLLSLTDPCPGAERADCPILTGIAATQPPPANHN